MGVYLVSFFFCVQALVYPEYHLKSWKSINKKMLIAALSMCIFASLDVAFGLAHNVIAFIKSGDPTQEFERTSYWVNVMKMGCYVGQTFIGDLILIYRTWVVYGHSYWVVALPVTIWLAGSVCGVMVIFLEATQHHNTALLNSSDLIPFISSMLALTLSVNLFSTSLIVYRIHSIRLALKQRSIIPRNSPLSHIVRVFIESGLMYTASIVILFGLYVVSNNAQLGVSDAIVQIIGIASNLIIIRVNSRNSIQRQSFSVPSGPSQSGMNKAPLHMINIQTTISRYPPDSPTKTRDSHLDLEAGTKSHSDHDEHVVR
ncbi:hypothetical protein BDN72DRAFT_343754 [Pluteus cervinus]|uniref:Uncharacterized protein n=1 Tax=Pluteus cervinus TaxID=181527 RepID=A0ACD3B345_9AGAR|nr:hypothetical protein BDN72DRAFT_343754 [Pluteus cervinus]